MAMRVAKWILIVAAVLAVIVGALLLAINTTPGRSFVLRQIAGFKTEAGISIRAQRIEGSLYGQMTLIRVELRDAKGAFLTSPEVKLDWRPFTYLRSKVDVRTLSAAQMRMTRMPELKFIPDDPILPDIDIAIGKFAIDQFIIEPRVTGQRHIVRMSGRADIADGRAQITANAAALEALGIAGGDRLSLTLDAVPDANRLIIDAKLDAPSRGLVDSYAKLGKPLQIIVGGRGDWKNWRGRAEATMAGVSLADLAITAREGTFAASGPTSPGPLLTGPAQRMITPTLAVDLVTKLTNRSADTKLILRSDAFVADATGIVDLGNSSFNDLRLNATLLRPGMIAENLSGRDVRLSAQLSGSFATPTVAYRLTAAEAAFGATGVEGLVATGRARVDTDRILIPVAVTARRVTGVNAAAGGLLTNLSIDGDFAYSGGRLLSDNLKLKSTRIDATAIVIADLNTGRYTGALKGRVNDYQVNGIGRINLVTDAALVTGPNGGFGISGVVRIVTRRLDNASVREQLGGNATVTARFGFDENGIVSVRALRMTSQGLRIVDGGGSYRPDGRIDFRAQGVSRQYGPVLLSATGTLERPVARLRAARPNIGVQLTDVEAELFGTAAGYQVRARGGSAYGPFNADLLIRSGRGPLAIDIKQLRFAGVGFSGGIVQTRAGPFAGTLLLAGSGLNGTVRLAAAGTNQRADVFAQASAARIAGDMPITIGSGVIRATAILFPNQPAVNADFNLTDVTQGTFTLAKAQGRIRFQNARGTAAIIANGRSSVPFELAAQAAFTPDRLFANARGTANGIAFRFASPAIATRARGVWTLQPATVVLPQGNIGLAGSYGNGTALRVQLDNVDLSLAKTFAPGLGLGGKASGTIDYTSRGGAVPSASARLTIARFTRTAAYTISAPVDIATLATLTPSGADIRAVVRRGGTPVGRLQARLAPLSSGGSLASRLLAAPLAGGIRYNGPAEVLWALTGIANQQLSGPIVVAADFGGRVNRPTLNGLVRANALRYENQTYGTIITNLALAGRFSQSQLQIVSLEGRAGRGSVSGRGSVGLDAASGFPIDFALTLANAQLARSDALGATATGKLNITNGANGGRISGDLNIPEARYEIIRQGAAEVADLSGVRRKNQPVFAARAAKTASFPSNFALDIRVRADNRIIVTGMGLEAEWSTDMQVSGNAAAPQVVGRLEIVRGTYSFAGRRFNLDNDGRITFNGALTNPALALTARTSVEGVSATIDIAGRAQNPQISFSSTPALPQDEVLSRLLFGSSVTSLSPTQAIQLAAALNSLRGSSGGLNPLGKLRSATGISRLRILSADKNAGRGTALAAGQYISNNIYVEVITDARGFTATQLEISLARALSILSQAGSFGGSSATLRYSKDY